MNVRHLSGLHTRELSYVSITSPFTTAEPDPAALVIFLLLTLLTGILYPLVVTGIAQAVLPVQANGNLIEHDGKIAGSSRIGQSFTSPEYFWGRPSATSPVPYNAGASSGSNLGPNNPALIDVVKARVDALHAADPENTQLIPVDLVTASGSGLDPDISIAAARYQVTRIARERNLDAQDILALVAQHTEPRQFGLFGEPRVNVLSLNLALDESQLPGVSPHHRRIRHRRTRNRPRSGCGYPTGSS